LVKQGDLLFTIDRRPFQNTLDQARANLELAQSNVRSTEADYARAQKLLKDHTISEQAYDQRAQAYRNAVASVAANEAMVKQAHPRTPPPRRGAPGPPAAAAPAASARATWSRAVPAAPRCSPLSSRWTRSGSNSPSMRPPICATSGCRAAAKK